MLFAARWCQNFGLVLTANHCFLSSNANIHYLYCHNWLLSCLIPALLHGKFREVRFGIAVLLSAILKYSPAPVFFLCPWNNKAKAILAKYADLETRLLPKINQNIYNRQIKKILKLLGIDRMVTVIDNKTREPIQKPICDIATSHTARKTFIGNLYKKVKDPNLVASLSGHTDGSRAFARYREIDNEMKRELVKLID